VVAAKDGTIAGLLGASPGASVSVQVMIDVLQKCFPEDFTRWTPKIQKMIPSFGTRLSDSPKVAAESLKHTAEVLKLTA
jgi:malate dehydrogenase (quinone)